jgi:hypothetical protein
LSSLSMNCSMAMEPSFVGGSACGAPINLGYM